MVTFAREMQLVREMLSDLMQVSKEGVIFRWSDDRDSGLCSLYREFLPLSIFSVSVQRSDPVRWLQGGESYVGNYFVDDHPAIFKLIEMVCGNAYGKRDRSVVNWHRTGVPLREYWNQMWNQSVLLPCLFPV